MSDVSQLLHPNVVYVAAEIRAGRLPLWNPYSSRECRSSPTRSGPFWSR